MAYLSGSNAKGESKQNLYIMNPSYSTYSDSSNSGNMVLLGPTGLANQIGNPGQQRQHQYAYSLPHNGPHQTESTQEIFATCLSNQGYNWNGGNELLFLPSRDIRGDSQSNSFTTGPSQTSSIMSHLDTTNLSQSSFHEQLPFIPSGIALGSSTQSLQTSIGAGQILSLSLSPQRPSLNQLQAFPILHPEVTVNGGSASLNNGVVENFSNNGGQWMGMGNALNSFRTSNPTLESGLEGQLTGAANNRQTNVLLGSLTVELYSSKYLKPAQQLLNEVVSVGRALKSDDVNQTKPQSWVTSNSFGSAYGQEKNSTATGSRDGGAIVNWANGKEGMMNVSAFSTPVSESQDQNVQNLIELTAADRQGLQIKKAKLLAMVEEVNQRYRQYYHQMQMVVASFETVAGLGAARTYTAMALQTISKHFKCLKDAIRGQIRFACKELGEEAEMGHGRGETSRLRFIDQQLRQQRALQQLGMMPQHPWRPQRGLPERSVSVLRAWLFEHFLHPYPKDSDKVFLARQTGLTRNQVSNWFINARVRLWKPMVEEMYAEEVKDEDVAEGVEKPIHDKEDDGGTGRKDGSDRSPKQGNISKFQNGGLVAFEQDNDTIQSKILMTASSADRLLLAEGEAMDQGFKRARNNNVMADQKTKSYDLLHSRHALAKASTDEAFGIPSGLLSPDDVQNAESYGVLRLSGLNSYADGSLAAPHPNNSAVSLTLGLQSQIQVGRRAEGEMDAINFYGMHDMPGGQSGNFEAMNLQGPRRFTGYNLQQDYT